MSRIAKCRRKCGTDVLVVVSAEFDELPLEVNQIPVGRPVDGYEHHPLFGWNDVHEDIGFKRRGHPVHALHVCPEGATA